MTVGEAVHGEKLEVEAREKDKPRITISRESCDRRYRSQTKEIYSLHFQ